MSREPTAAPIYAAPIFAASKVELAFDGTPGVFILPESMFARRSMLHYSLRGMCSLLLVDGWNSLAMLNNHILWLKAAASQYTSCVALWKYVSQMSCGVVGRSVGFSESNVCTIFTRFGVQPP